MTSSPPGPYAGIPLWLRPIPRRPGEVQFGVGEGGPIVTGVSADEARLLARLDGTMPLDALGAVAGAVGVSGRRWRVLLDLVARLGLLEPSPAAPRAAGPALRDRTQVPGGLTVLVEGPGSLSTALAQVLATEPGLQVRHGCSGEATTSSLTTGGARRRPDRQRIDRQRTAGSVTTPLPGLVVLVADIALDPRRGDIWLARQVAHLPVVTTGHGLGASTVVGPLVAPLVGTRDDAPCLWCLDLHRSDRDEAWPTVMAQVAPGGPVTPCRARPPACRTSSEGSSRRSSPAGSTATRHRPGSRSR